MSEGSRDPAALAARIAELEAALAAERKLGPRARRASPEVEAEARRAEKMEAVARLASGISHDFNNILTAIMGHAALAMDASEEDSPARQDVAEIFEAVERGAELTRQLLTLGRRQVLRPAPMDLNEVVADAAKLLRKVLGEEIDLEVDLASGLGLLVADRAQIEQVVMILAANARDAMPEGGVLTIATAEVRLAEDSPERPRHLPPGTYARLTVEDTGTGMAPAVQGHLFEPYFTTKERGRSAAGLGLAAAHGIVTQSEGAIDFVTAPDNGTVFRVLLPTGGGKGARAQRRPGAQGALDGTETILLVEDDASVRSLVHRALEARGYRVEPAADGVEALAVAGELDRPIDLLLTDIVMPRMKGPELVARLAKRSPDILVLYISGYPDEWGLLQACLTEEEDLLQKPFSTETLLRKVREILDRAKAALH